MQFSITRCAMMLHTVDTLSPKQESYKILQNFYNVLT
jgi:hypothetical protein